MNQHKAVFGDYGDPEGWALLKIREEGLKEEYGKASGRHRECEEEALEKKQRVS